MNNGNYKKRGFTIVETLVAVSILLVGVAVAFSTAHLGVSSTNEVRNRIAAIFLAQEGIEGVKNIKDSNLLKRSQGGEQNRNWLEGITNFPGACSSNYGCGYDIFGGPNENGELHLCDQSGTSCEIQEFERDGVDLYRQADYGGSAVNFVRRIYVDEVKEDAEARVRVVITQKDDPSFYYEVTAFMYNWF
jgi:prepilin-type N-terminal cleavage/methylation domain-containing protein